LLSADAFAALQSLFVMKVDGFWFHGYFSA
jgi:hypothetical protein